MAPFALLVVLGGRPGWAAPATVVATEAAVPAAMLPAGAPDGQGRRVALLRFSGPDAELIRTAAVAAVMENFTYTLVSIGLVETQAGLPGDLLKMVAELARRLDLAAVVGGRVTPAGPGSQKERRLTLTVFDGASGAVLGQVSHHARSPLTLHAVVRDSALVHLAPLLARTASPAPGRPPANASPVPPVLSSDQPAAEPARAPPVEETRPGRIGGTPCAVAPPVARVTPAAPLGVEPQRQEPPAHPTVGDEPPPVPPPAPSRRCEIVELTAHGGVMLRRFDYRDERRGALRAYVLSGAPAGRVEGAFYPIGGSRCRAGVAFGLRGAYELMAPLTSHLGDRSLDTSAFAYQGEAVLRISRGAFTLKPSVGFFARRFVLKGDAVPSVDYRAIGGGLEASLRSGTVSFDAGGGVRRILDAGELTGADWFPRASGVVYTAQARVGVVVADWLDFVVGAAAEYVSFDLHADPFGPSPNGVAGGAYDVTFVGSVGLRVRLPGQAGSVTSAQ
ncbi:MAG: hypothetical protein ABUS79_08610 [Pseudomonadota bacterium]